MIAAGVLLATPCVAGAQQPARAARIGFLSLDRAGNPRGTDSFVLGLRELGYVVGRNIVVEYRDAERRLERFPVLVAELVALNVDVMVAPSVVACQAAKRATRTIPIVFAGIADPVSDGLVDSRGRPGGNVTGLSNLSPELVGKRLELLKEAKASDLPVEQPTKFEFVVNARTAKALGLTIPQSVFGRADDVVL